MASALEDIAKSHNVCEIVLLARLKSVGEHIPIILICIVQFLKLGVSFDYWSSNLVCCVDIFLLGSLSCSY